MPRTTTAATAAACLMLLAGCGHRLETVALNAAHDQAAAATQPACAQVQDESLSNVRRGLVYRHDGQAFDPPAEALFASYHYTCAGTTAQARPQTTALFVYIDPRTQAIYTRLGDSSAPADTVLAGFN